MKLTNYYPIHFYHLHVICCKCGSPFQRGFKWNKKYYCNRCIGEEGNKDG